MNRIDKALYLVDRAGLGLEIGPSFDPIAPKRAGFQVEILDHASADELRDKYRGHGVPLDKIEEVDYVWHGEPLDQLIGKSHVYDYIVASHVIEHTPDLISFLSQCEALLRPNGVLSLVIPDKRYCFDYFRWPSSTGDVLQAFADRRTRHTPGTVFDSFSLAATLGKTIAWSPTASGDVDYLHGFEQARTSWREAVDGEQYIDVHNWRFTPSSFRLILCDLRLLSLSSFQEACGYGTEGCEFFITLKRATAPANQDERLALARLTVAEIVEGMAPKEVPIKQKTWLGKLKRPFRG